MKTKKQELNQSPCLSIADVSIQLSLTKTNISTGVSFLADCGFWATKYDDIFITDYNLRESGFSQTIGEANLLKSKGLISIFCAKKGFYMGENISATMLNDTDLMLNYIDAFYKKIQEEILKIN